MMNAVFALRPDPLPHYQPRPSPATTAPPTGLQRFLWSLGGFSADVLSMPQCIAIRSKYSSMGMLILLTSVLGSCSTAYALYTVFRTLYACPVAIFWGLFIFYIDRLLVSSHRKAGSIKDFHRHQYEIPPYMSQVPWVGLAFRLLLAFVIGVVMSVPVETRLMLPWVAEFERSDAIARQQAVEKDPRLLALRKDIKDAADALHSSQDETNKRAKDAADEVGSRNGRPGPGQIYDALNKLYTDQNERLKQQEKSLTDLQQRYTTLHDQLAQVTHRQSEARAREGSFMQAYLTTRLLASEQSPKGETVKHASYFLALLFILIECMPVLVKASSPFDPYDAAVQALEYGGIMSSLVDAQQHHARASL